MLKAMHVEELMVRQKENMINMMSSFVSKDMPEDARKEALRKEADIFDTLLKWDTLKQDFIQIYSEVYSEQELKDLTAFYNSPVGRKFVEKMPDLQKKTLEVMQKRMALAMPALQKLRAQAAKPSAGASAAPAAPSPATTP